MAYLTIEQHLLDENFPDKPFLIKHQLINHELFTLNRLLKLASDLPEDKVEYNSGDISPGQKAEDTPKISLSVSETIKQIETCHAWMVLKNVEYDPEYQAFIKITLEELATSLPVVREPLGDQQGFIFISSANSTTPFHNDAEENMFVHIKGEKFFHMFNNDDRSIASEEDMEISPSKYRNIPYNESYEGQAEVFHLQDGDGVMVPYMIPHWVRTGGDEYSISMAITWKRPSVLRQNKIRFMNAQLRALGFPQRPPGFTPLWDNSKILMHDAIRLILDPLRKSDRLRSLLRRIIFGRNANYYLDK